MGEDALRCIETHAAGEESAGSVWGLRYELLWFGLSGVILSVLIVAGLFAKHRESLSGIILAGTPAAITLALASFRQTHPPGYDTDLLDLWLHGPGFGPNLPDRTLL